MKSILKSLLRRIGLQVRKYPDTDLKRRMAMVRAQGIDLILDIGANEGQYGHKMRQLGYTGRLVSFEPAPDAFLRLEARSARDPHWEVCNYALGAAEDTVHLNLSANSSSSSLLPILQCHLESDPNARFIDSVPVPMKRLDSVFHHLAPQARTLMVKIDAQGYEKQILDGASAVMEHIRLLQLEMSLVPLYDTETLFQDWLPQLSSLGFELISLENGFYNSNTGRLLQVDGIFLNSTDAATT